MSDEKIKTMGIPFSVWGDVTEEKVKKAIEEQSKRLINDEKLAEEIKGKKDKLLQVRISPEYYESLKDSAKERNMNVSLLVREAIMQYIPATLTNKEKDLGKISHMARMIWTLANINPAIKEQYNYDISWHLPDEQILIDMFNDNAFKSIKLQAISSIIGEIMLNDSLDKEIDEAIKKLIKVYMSK